MLKKAGKVLDRSKSGWQSKLSKRIVLSIRKKISANKQGRIIKTGK
jgi:hypothetical protein